MRLLVLSLALISSNTLRLCESSEEGAATGTATAAASGQATAETAASANVPATAAVATSLKAEIGGNLVTVGNHVVEVAVHRQGLVEATVRTPDGKAVSPASVDLSAQLHARAGAHPRVKLAWDPLHARFRGRADAHAELSTEPVEISLTVDGAPATAKLEHYAVLTGPDFGGQVVGAGEYGAEILADADGSLKAFVRTASGADVKGDANVQVELEATAEGGAAHGVRLGYSAPDLAFKGRAGVKLAPGPLKLTIKAGGKTHVGGLGRIALRASASHGGRVVVVGDYSVELVAESPRVIAAYVFDASGKAAAGGDLQLKLALGADARQNLSLKWDAPSASYRAELDANADFRAEPVRISLEAGGRAHAGALASFAGDAKLATTAKATVSARAPAASAKLDAKAQKTASASARVNATAPKVSVKKSASAGTSASGGGAKAGAKAGVGFSLGGK